MFGASFFSPAYFARTYFPATTGFASWLALSQSSRVVLCEIQPAEELTGWTNAGGGIWSGYPNAWAVSWSSIVQDDVVAGGVYRRLDFVRVNDEDLVEVASPALVDATPGSFCLDGGSLYIQTATSADPNTFSFVGAFFSLFLATEPVDFVGGELYEPRLTGALPEIRAQVADPLFGAAVYPTGDVEVNNADGFFDRLVRRYIWKNKTATFRFGGLELDFSEFVTVAVMKIEDLAPGDALCRFRLRALASSLDKILPLNTISADDSPDAGEGVEGSYKPVLVGSVTDITPPAIDATPGAEVYLVTDPELGLAAVSAVRAIDSSGAVTTLALTTDYTVDLAAGTVSIVNAMYSAADYEIRVDASGPSDGAGGALSKFGEIAKALLVALGESLENIDEASFAAADVACDYALGLWMVEPKPASEYIRILERSVLGALTVSNAGKWTASIWDPTYVPADLQAFEDEDFVRFEPDDKIESVFSLVRVKYGYKPAAGSWSVASHSSGRTRYAYETTDAITLETALRSGAAATAIAQRYSLISATPSIEVEIEERGLRGMALALFEKVSVTRSRAPSLSGSWDGQILEVLGVTKTLSPPRAAFRLGDLRGFGNSIGHWAADSAPDYASATEAERAACGYWADDDGLVDPSDTSTRNRSTWW